MDDIKSMDMHNDSWIERWTEDYFTVFEQEKRAIEESLSAYGLKAEIHHVGGTSVIGLSGKPIIDILVCPENERALDDVVPALTAIGYNNLGECGRPGRYFMSKGFEPGKTFYLHLCHADHRNARDQLLFKKILEENEMLRVRYSYIKYMLACLFPHDRGKYRMIKGLFITGVLGGYRHAMGDTDPAAVPDRPCDDDEA